jgi:hypothetical protein
MKIEDFRIGMKVQLRYSSEDWFADWQHNTGPYEVVALSNYPSRFSKTRNEVVTIEADGCHFDFDAKDVEEWKQ